MSVSINKVLSECSHVHLRMVCGYFCATMAGRVIAAKIVWPAKLELFAIWLFTERGRHNCSFVDYCYSLLPCPPLLLLSSGLSSQSSLSNSFEAQIRSLFYYLLRVFPIHCNKTLTVKAQLFMVAKTAPHILAVSVSDFMSRISLLLTTYHFFFFFFKEGTTHSGPWGDWTGNPGATSTAL